MCVCVCIYIYIYNCKVEFAALLQSSVSHGHLGILLISDMLKKHFIIISVETSCAA